MKGVSTVIATILMLMITIALAGTAYIYITNSFNRELQGIEVTNSFCSGSTVTITIRNTGTAPISSITCQQTSPANDNGAPCTSTPSSIAISIDPGATNSFTDICSGSGPRSCVYSLTPPTGRSIPSFPVTCS